MLFAPWRLLLPTLCVDVAVAGVIGERHVVEELRKPREIRMASSRLHRRHDSNRLFRRADFDPTKLYPGHNFSVPVDHFQNDERYEPHSNATFPIRYWYDATYYKPGGPVIALASGETSGEDRLPYLQKGIVNILTKATNGIGVILEHRYYGTSFPVPDLSVENLRFLTTEQALADTAYLAENIVFEGLEDLELTASDTPWIVYGGSYAGAFVAFLRVLYPDTFWGAISSSGVTKAIIDYWQYWEPIRLFGPQDCVHTTQDFVEVVDGILIDNPKAISSLKSTFGLSGISDNTDFASALANYGIGGWQGRNWDPAVSSKSFDNYCNAITNNTLIYPRTASLKPAVQNLTAVAGQPNKSEKYYTRLLNWIGFVNATIVTPCTAQNQTQDQCYGTYNQTFYDQKNYASQAWRSWAYQYCTEWGFYQTGSGVPSYIKPLLSRTIDVEYSSTVCRMAFNITDPPEIEIINKLGGFRVHYPRLAIIDGQADPWRYATPHAPSAPKRTSTWEEPFIEIEGAVHHWDENGLFANETTATLPPEPVKAAQKAEVAFVRKWVAEYYMDCRWKDDC